MSKKWIAGFIADPTDPKFYGNHNDRMPAYHPEVGDALMSAEEVEMIADWMHGDWYRAPEVENKTVLGRDNEILPGLKIEKEGEDASAPDEAAETPSEE